MSNKGSRADLTGLVAALIETEQLADGSHPGHRNQSVLRDAKTSASLEEESDLRVLRLTSVPSQKAARQHTPIIEASEAEIDDVANLTVIDKLCSIETPSSILQSGSTPARGRTPGSVTTSRTPSPVSTTAGVSLPPTTTTTPATSIKTSLDLKIPDVRCEEIPSISINDEPFDHAELDFSTPYPPSDPNSRIERSRKEKSHSSRLISLPVKPPVRKRSSRETWTAQQLASEAQLAVPRKGDRIPNLDWFVLPPTSAAIVTALPTTSALTSMVPALMKWRLITFYGPFFMHVVREKMAAAAASCLSSQAHRIQIIDWNRTWNTYTNYMNSNKNRRSLSTILTRLPQVQTLNNINSAAAHHQINPLQLATAIESLALALNPSARNLTALHLAETRDFTRLARLILLDIDFLTDRTERVVHDSLGGRRRVLTACQEAVQEDRSEIKKAVFGCAKRYFKVLEWDDGWWRRVKRNRWFFGEGNGERRVSYRLVDELDSRLDGQEALEREMRTQGGQSHRRS